MSKKKNHIYEDYSLSVEYTGDKASPADPDNMHHHGLSIWNIKSGVIETFSFWGTPTQSHMTSEKEVMKAFYKLLQSAIIGGLSAENFCKMVHMNPENEAAQAMFKTARTTTDKMFNVVPENFLSVIKRLERDGIYIRKEEDEL